MDQLKKKESPSTYYLKALSILNYFSRPDVYGHYFFDLMFVLALEKNNKELESLRLKKNQGFSSF